MAGRKRASCGLELCSPADLDASTKVRTETYSTIHHCSFLHLSYCTFYFLQKPGARGDIFFYSLIIFI